MTTTPNMGMVLADINGDLNDWGRILNEALADRIDIHDHTTGKGVPIVAAALDIDADVSWTSHAITDVLAMAFTPTTSGQVASYTTALFSLYPSGDLYFRNLLGTNVKITDGSTLAITSSGGFGGDYVAAAAEAAYVDASDLYTFKQQVATAVRQYARLAGASIDLYEYFAAGATPVPTNRVRLQGPAALAASYALTYPAALPGSTLLQQVSAAGVMTWSNTVAGLITASLGVTAAAGQHITVSTTGRFKHGDLIRSFLPITGADTGSAWTFVTDGYITSGGAAARYIPLVFDVGERIRSLTVRVIGNGAADGNIQLWSGVDGTGTSRGSVVITNAAASWATFTISSIDYTVVAGDRMFLSVDANAASLSFGSIQVTYDRP